MAEKKGTSYRLPKSTESQIDFLIEETGMTQTQIVILAVDRLAQFYKAEKGKNKMYEVEYEIVTDGQGTINSTMTVEATSEARALEHATNVLEEQYEGGTLLECKVV